MCDVARFQTMVGRDLSGTWRQRPSPAIRVRRLPRDAAHAASSKPRHLLEQVVGVEAVVVGPADDVGVEVRQRGVPSARQAGGRPEVQHVEPRVRLDHGDEPVVGVLVDEEHPEAARWLWWSSERRSRSSSVVRSSVATTRSNVGVSGGIGAGYRRGGSWARSRTGRSSPSCSRRATRGRTSRSRCGASSARRSPTSSSWSSTTAPRTARGVPRLGRRPAARGRPQRHAIGLAAALNLGIERAQGRVSRPDGRRRRRAPGAARAPGRPPERHAGHGRRRHGRGRALCHGELGRVHLVPGRPEVTRYRALFGTPFFHPSVLLDRAILEQHGLVYDPAFAVAQDYELWGRLLDVVDGDNIPEPLVLYRAHPGQASATSRASGRSSAGAGDRSHLAAAPGLGEDGAELAWLAGDARPVPGGREADAATRWSRCSTPSTRRRPCAGSPPAPSRGSAAPRAGPRPAGRPERPRLDPALPVTVARLRMTEAREARARERFPAGSVRSTTAERRHRPRHRRVAGADAVPRAAVRPARGARADIDLLVVYAAADDRRPDVGGRIRHPHVVLRGVRVPGARGILRHDYPVTPRHRRRAPPQRPDVVVVSGWSTFASQAAIAWCRATGVPYVLQVESHDAGPAAAWRRAVKGAVVPRIVRGAAAVLVTGIARPRVDGRAGRRPPTIGSSPNTVDVAGYAARRRRAPTASARAARARSGSEPTTSRCSRRAAVAGEGDRHAASRRVARPRAAPVLVLVGDGPERESSRASRRARRAATCDGTCRGSGSSRRTSRPTCSRSPRRHEPWGVVVNEAAACGLPLVLSEQRRRGPRPARTGRTGSLVPARRRRGGCSARSRELVRRRDAPTRRGARSREIAAGWGYGPSVDAFVHAVRRAAGLDLV